MMPGTTLGVVFGSLYNKSIDAQNRVYLSSSQADIIEFY